MDSPRILSIIVPAYNEEKTIAEILKRIEAVRIPGWRKEIIVVDDGSTDGTRNILERLNDPNITVVMRSKNGGKGAAERDGIKSANGEYLIFQDADLEYNPEDIVRLIEYVDRTNAQVVFGARHGAQGASNKRPAFFGLGVAVSTWLVNALYGTNLKDAWTCYKLFSREVASHARIIGNGFEADYLFIGEIASLGYKIAEVPISYSPRSMLEGKKIRYRDGISSMMKLIAHRVSTIGRTKM